MHNYCVVFNFFFSYASFLLSQQYNSINHANIKPFFFVWWKMYSHTQQQQKVHDRENDILMIREQYGAVQKLYSCRLSEVTLKLKYQTKTLKAEQRRRRLEAEGYGVDISNLKKEVFFFKWWYIYILTCAHNCTHLYILCVCVEYTCMCVYVYV